MADTPNSTTTTNSPLDNQKLTEDQAAAFKAAADALTVPTPKVETPKEGEKALLSAVYGYLVHPEAKDAKGRHQSFDTGEITAVVFDWWHKIQFEAGKLILATV